MSKGWLSTKTGREKAAIIIPVVLAATGGLWGLYVYLNDRGALEYDYVLCVAADEQQCAMEHSDFAGCGAKGQIFVTKMCHDVQEIYSREGGMCGVRVYRGKCTAK